MPVGHVSPTFDCEEELHRRRTMHETYRTLGRERELDFEREAVKHRLAAALPPKPGREAAPKAHSRRLLFLVPRSLLARLDPNQLVRSSNAG
jgi:hypothetical protein